MPANAIIHHDPFRMHIGTQIIPIPDAKTISSFLFENGFLSHRDGKLVRTRPYLVIVNGEYVLEKDWNRILHGDDLIQLNLLPRGGGGNGGGSSLGKILGAVLIAAAAYFTFGLSLLAAAAVGVAAFAVMSLIGNAVPLPNSSASAIGREASSPTYSINAQGNQARLFEAQPRVYGRMKTYPDLASQPYSEYEGNEQYLYQLFEVSLGYNEIEAMFFDDNNILGFADAQHQIVYPGQAVTLFPDNVVTADSVSDLVMVGVNNPAHTYLGPFVAAPADTLTNAIAVDLVLPRGAGELDDAGNTVARTISFSFDYQLIDDLGAVIGPWTTFISQAVTYATSNAQMLSFKASVPEGRYQVRGIRTSAEADTDRKFDDLQWTGLRAYLQSTHVFEHSTVIAVKIRATNALNSSTARKFSVISKSYLQKWDPVNGWTAAVFTDSPAWIAADILRNPVYGRGLLTERFNVQELYRLAGIWETRGDRFNGVFDTTSQLWDALMKVCRVGRTVPIYYAGVIDFVRDEPQSVPKAMFQPSNMVSGSFKTTYNFFTNDTPDHVVIEYIDETTWLPSTVECRLPGEPFNRARNLQLFGCTNREQAWREGMSIAAANRDRRRTITFTSTSAGYIPYYNSLARIAHDVPQWGYFGRVLSLNPATGQLRTTEPIVFDEGVDHIIAFRKRNGAEDGPYDIIPDPLCIAGDGIYGCIVDADEVDLAAIYVSDGLREDFTYYQCGPVERAGLLALVIAAKPTADGKVNLTCINYADSVHNAELGGATPPPPPSSNLATTPSLPIVSSVNVVYTVTLGEQNIIATPAAGAIYYEFRAMPAGGDWINLGTDNKPTLISHLSPGVWTVQVRGVGRATGPWATWDGTIEATTLPTASLDLFVAVEKLFAIGLEWAYNATSNTIAKKIEIFASLTNSLGSALKLVELPYPIASYDHTNLPAAYTVYYWARVVDTAGRTGPWFNSGTAVVGQTSSDASKILAMLTEQITETQLSEELLETILSDDGAIVLIEAIEDELAAMYTIKTQLTVGGIPYLAGIGVGVENDDGIITSQILLAAARVAILDETSGSTIAPFIVTGGQVFINSAVIQDASITNAKIGGFIQSGNYVAGWTGWRIDKNGDFYNNGSGGDGRRVDTSTATRIYYASGQIAAAFGIGI